MYKLLSIIAVVFLFLACNSGKVEDAVSENGTTFNVDSERRADSLEVLKNKKLFKAYKLNKDYLVIDTGYFSAGTIEGQYGIVQRTNVTDTIHLGLGMKQLANDKYFYLSLTKYNTSAAEQVWPGEISATFHHYTIATTDKKILLDEAIENFDTYKSAPSVINGKIYFWQYKKTNDIYKVSAAEYNMQTGSTKSHSLFSGDLLDNEHISSPYYNNNIIEFNWERRNWKFSSDFKVIK